MGKKVSTSTIVILLLLALTIYGLDLFDPRPPKDVIGETLQTLREHYDNMKHERAAKKKAEEKERKEKEEKRKAQCAAAKSRSSLFLFFFGEDPSAKDCEDEEEWSCDCNKFDCYDDEPVDCECENALEAAEYRILELEEKLLSNGISIH